MSKKNKPGNVLDIPLPNKKFAFGRLYKDSCIAIYNHIGLSINDVPKSEDYRFTVGVYQHVLKSGEWIIADERPFETEEEMWPPPMCVIDKLTGEYSIYHKGEIVKASKEDCEGLETTAVWDKNHIIDRIMGDDKWNRM